MSISITNKAKNTISPTNANRGQDKTWEETDPQTWGETGNDMWKSQNIYKQNASKNAITINNASL